MIVTDLLLCGDHIGAGYRIVALDDGQFAFVWGNIPASVGDELVYADPCEGDAGVLFAETYDGAVARWRACAEALAQTTSRAGAEMLAVLS